MRQTLHKLIGVLFWLLMAALWALLWREGKTSPEAFGSTGVRIAVLAGTVLAVTTWWVRHNMAIYRRKGPRSGRPGNLPRTDADRLGRTVEWELRGGHLAAHEAPHLVIDLGGEVKTYRAAA